MMCATCRCALCFSLSFLSEPCQIYTLLHPSSSASSSSFLLSSLRPSCRPRSASPSLSHNTMPIKSKCVISVYSMFGCMRALYRNHTNTSNTNKLNRETIKKYILWPVKYTHTHTHTHTYTHTYTNTCGSLQETTCEFFLFLLWIVFIIAPYRCEFMVSAWHRDSQLESKH